jgi:uncharacterized protein YegP (UPF0339 family)
MAKLDTYQREDGLWDFRVVADNGEQVGESLQGFTSETDALRGFDALARAVLELLSSAVDGKG